MTIANPIYDSVFKFLMEDNRVAKTILSALLKEDVISVEVRPHEYSNSQRDKISMFRIDFAATVRRPDGEEKLTLIEVQKTWLETETLRFRQYLGVQYQRKENIIADSAEGYALPMVAIYILGHKVGDIEEPVLYVNHQSFDYDGRVVTKGLPNPFVDSLTHSSIIVQIPRLHGRINNRLDKVLSVFDQTRQLKQDQHLLNLDDGLYLDDTEMQPILHRLLMAASDADTRQDMNVEDEYYSIIEKRDTEILLNAQKIAAQRMQIAQQDEKLAQQDEKLAKQGEKLAQQGEKISKQDELLAQQGEKLAQQDEKLAKQDDIIRSSVRLLAEAGLDKETIAHKLMLSPDDVGKLMK